MITDEQRLLGAKTKFGHVIKVWDDGFGPLWVCRNSMGIAGIVRARTWETAWSCCEDEIFPRASDEDQRDFVKDYGPNFMDDAAWQDAYGFSGNNGIYEKDLNGDFLDLLTDNLVELMGIELEISQPEPAEASAA